MSVSITPPMFLQFFVPGTNQPAVGYQLFTYIAGTSTKQATWTDSTQTVQNANPIIADANGVMIVWVDPTLTYKFVLAAKGDTDPPSSPIYSVDNIEGSLTAATLLSVLTQSVVGQLLYPRTAAEIAAGVTPSNYAYAPGVIDRYGTNSTPGTTDMSAALVAASKCNSYVRGLSGSTYNFASCPVLSASNFTLDLTGCTIVTTGSPSNTVGLMQFIPASLVASGRLAGTDYPSNWKNGSTPEPTDGDPNTMMHENTVANRLKNITVIGLTTTAAMNGLMAYSVDGLTLKSCTMACNGWSNVRMFHCTDISIDSSNSFGGSGTYLVFGLKCGNGITVTANFNSSSIAANGRALSFKGARHTPVTTSIFVASAAQCDMQARISGSFISNLDCLAFDSTPTLTADCNSAAQGGAGTGVIAGPWYGTGINFKAIGGSFNTSYTTTAGNENKAGRAFFTSDPHQDVHFDNNQCSNATVSFAGIVGGTIKGNTFAGTVSGYSVIVNPTGNNPSNITQQCAVSDNVDIGWTQVSGSSVAACMQIGGNYHVVRGNVVMNPGAGLLYAIVENTCDYSIFEDNTLSYTSAVTPTYTVSIDSNNAHGQQWNNNKMINVTTGVTLYSSYQGSTSGSIPDGGTVGHKLYSTPSSVTLGAVLAGTIATATGVSSTSITIALKTGGGGSASAQSVYFSARV